MNNDVCEICGRAGETIMVTVPGPGGVWLRVVVHVVCENSRYARLAQQRERAAWN